MQQIYLLAEFTNKLDCKSHEELHRLYKKCIVWAKVEITLNFWVATTLKLYRHMVKNKKCQNTHMDQGSQCMATNHSTQVQSPVQKQRCLGITYQPNTDCHLISDLIINCELLEFWASLQISYLSSLKFLEGIKPIITFRDKRQNNGDLVCLVSVTKNCQTPFNQITQPRRGPRHMEHKIKIEEKDQSLSYKKRINI